MEMLGQTSHMILVRMCLQENIYVGASFRIVFKATSQLAADVEIIFIGLVVSAIADVHVNQNLGLAGVIKLNQRHIAVTNRKKCNLCTQAESPKKDEQTLHVLII
ncbi:hypothetical protein ACH5Y9_07120 [Methylomonas sp. BW4-1]